MRVSPSFLIVHIPVPYPKTLHTKIYSSFFSGPPKTSVIARVQYSVCEASPGLLRRLLPSSAESIHGWYDSVDGSHSLAADFLTAEASFAKPDASAFLRVGSITCRIQPKRAGSRNPGEGSRRSRLPLRPFEAIVKYLAALAGFSPIRSARQAVLRTDSRSREGTV